MNINFCAKSAGFFRAGGMLEVYNSKSGVSVFLNIAKSWHLVQAPIHPAGSMQNLWLFLCCTSYQLNWRTKWRSILHLVASQVAQKDMPTVFHRVQSLKIAIVTYPPEKVPPLSILTFFFSTNNNIFFSNKNQVAQSVVKNSNLKLCFLRHSFQFQMRLHSKTARLTPRDVHRAPQPSQPSGETAGWSPATFLPGRPVFFEKQKGATETEETTSTKIGHFVAKTKVGFWNFDPKDWYVSPLL